MAIVEFRKGISELQVEKVKDKDGNDIEVRSQDAAFDQGDGFPIKVNIRLFGSQEAYPFGKYSFGQMSDFFQIKKFNGKQQLALVDFVPRLKPIVSDTQLVK